MLSGGCYDLAGPVKVSLAVKNYSARRGVYEDLAQEVERILREVLDGKSLNYHSITSRGKDVASYERKARDGSYTDPEREIMDMAGVRIITYTQSDAEKASATVRGLFDVIPAYSVDKTAELGTDRVGYRSIHYIATLGEGRLRLPENKIFHGIRFEIQVRTILQHAWAEFEHDRNYKFAGVIPDHLKRRVSLLAGSLETIEREFDSIEHAIDEYAGTVDKKTEAGELDVPIDSTSLTTYMKRRFAFLIRSGTVVPDFGFRQFFANTELVEELQDMGIRTLKELDKVIPPGLEEAETKSSKDSLAGLLRNIMIILDADRYFETAWKHHWDYMDPGSAKLLEGFGVRATRLARKHGIAVQPEPF
jgi:ppGpp synthetase/RelA/SpoT-type nucleotidyltranferase